jgi:RNA exonuclease NGL2
VDRLEKLIPPLKNAGYSTTYAVGNGKRHGCMILHREVKLRKVNERVVHLDEQYIREGDGTDSLEDIRRRRGSTRQTKNIVLLVALANTIEQGTVSSSAVEGYIVATCHLFWHPRHVYERARYSDSYSMVTLAHPSKNKTRRDHSSRDITLSI